MADDNSRHAQCLVCAAFEQSVPKSMKQCGPDHSQKDKRAHFLVPSMADGVASGKRSTDQLSVTSAWVPLSRKVDKAFRAFVGHGLLPFF
ncbi:MAG: hypothetical protein AAGA08_05695 [Pseudomonadota bacterium]